jgi:L-seryl-tRNA(Ser) seleniumtransferase
VNGGTVRGGRAALPAVDTVLRHPATEAAIARHGRRSVTIAVRTVLDALRRAVDETDAPDAGPVGPEVGPEDVARRAAAMLEARAARGIRPVLNATGVVLHTNLGRAPLSVEARAAVLGAAGYATTEFDLATGRRGARTAHVSELAAELCDAEAATAVNNGAAALMLAIDALARGGEVIVSRGELVEIGGEFRLPDIIARAGARLVEVGTTNRTRVEDYRDAIGSDTRLILKVHPSNFRMVGFTADADVDGLARLGAEHALPVVLDAGSGLIAHGADAPREALADEPAIRAAIAQGADLVIFSGDKLLGGPQAGLLVGRRDLVERCARSPLARVVRIDKLQIAALEATLRAHLRGTAETEVPALQMMALDLEQLQRRSERLADTLRDAGGGTIEVTASDGVVGGGAAPERALPSCVLAIACEDADRLLAELRRCDPPVIARIVDDRVLLDLRTVPATEDEMLARLVATALRG